MAVAVLTIEIGNREALEAFLRALAIAQSSAEDDPWNAEIREIRDNLEVAKSGLVGRSNAVRS